MTRPTLGLAALIVVASQAPAQITERGGGTTRPVQTVPVSDPAKPKTALDDVLRKAAEQRAGGPVARSQQADPPKTEKKEPAGGAKANGLDLSADEKAVIDGTNAERKAAGLGELKPNAALLAAARKHAANMAKQEHLNHTLDGNNMADRIAAEGYKISHAGENIAHNQRTPKDVVGDWMRSSGHKANILSKDYTEIGVAVVKSAKGEPYWVQVFAAPR